MRPIISTIHTANDSTVMPNSTAKTLLGAATIILPSWAKSVMAVSAKTGSMVPVASVSFTPQVDVESNDLRLMPFQVFGPPIASIVGNASQNVSKPEIYQINAPCNGGEQISVYGTALQAPGSTLTPYVGANLIVSNMSPNVPQRRSKTGTLTVTGTTSGADVAGTRYNFSGGSHIVEVIGVLNDLVPTASTGFTGHYKLTSNEFDGVSEVKCDFRSIAGSIGTTGNGYIDGVSRLPLDIPVQPGQGQVNIQDYAYFSNISSSQGAFCTGVMYE